jgi:hypothetical protein
MEEEEDVKMRWKWCENDVKMMWRWCEVNEREMRSEWWIALQEQYDEEAEDEGKEDGKDKGKNEGKDKSKSKSMIICLQIWRQHIYACTHRCECQWIPMNANECQWMSMNVNEFQGSSSRDSFTEGQLYVCIEDLPVDGYLKQCQALHIMC